MNQHFLQSKSWENFLKSENKDVFRFSGDGYECLASLEKTPLGNYLYCPYGPNLDSKKSLKKALKALKELGKEKSAIFIRVEPTLAFSAKEMAKYGLKKSKDINPSDTYVLDLSGTDDELSAKLPSRLRRYYRQMSKNSLEITTSTNEKDVRLLTKLQSDLAHKKSISFADEEHYKKQLAAGFGTLYFLKQGKETLAAGLILDYGSTRFNLQGAQSNKGAHLHATGILTIQLILDAKSKGLKTFDFWGIAPDGAKKSHPWAGFTAFKKSFDGTPVHYSGTYDLPLNTPKYLAYSLLRKANLILRKIKS